MSRLSIFAEFWEFLKERKRFWLAPIVFILIAFSLLLVYTQASAIAPFIYTIF